MDLKTKTKAKDQKISITMTSLQVEPMSRKERRCMDKERLGSNLEASASLFKPNSPKQAHHEALASCALDSENSKNKEGFQSLENWKKKPHLSYKVRDNLQINGKRIPFADITTFVLKDGFYIPAFCCEEIKEDDIKIDMIPFLCVGISELTAMSITKESFDKELPVDLLDLIKWDYYDLEDYKRVRNELSQDSLTDNKNPMYIPLNMTSRFVDYRYEWICECAQSLYLQSRLSDREFISSLMNCVDGLYNTGLPFFLGISMTDKERLGSNQLNLFDGLKPNSPKQAHHEALASCVLDTEHKNTLYSLFPNLQQYPKEGMVFKKMGYCVNDDKYYISDCRGLSIYAFLIVMYAIYEVFGDTKILGSHILEHGMDYDEVNDCLSYNLLSCFKNCLGNDFIGKYFELGRFHISKCSYEGNYYVIGHMRSVATGSKMIKGVPKQQYENEIVLRKAFGMQRTANYNRDGHDDTGIHYFSVFELLGFLDRSFNVDTVVDAAESQRLISDTERQIKKLVSENERLTSIAADYKQLKSKEAEKSDYQKLLDDRDKRIKELEYQLSVKSGIIENMTQELKEEKTKNRNIFLEETVENEDFASEISVSQTEMIDYLNNFRILMIGGRNDLLDKLADMGWTNVDQLTKENTNAVGSKTDFFCVNTKFVAHRLVCMVESAYPDRRDQMLYYNGTNPDKLIQICYQFVKNWMN